MPLTPAQFRENLRRRIAATYEEDEREAARLRSLLPEAVQLITGTLGPRRVVLYGSLARGTFFAARSDVDLAVEGVGEAPPDELRSALVELLGRKVDVVDPALVAPLVRKDIEELGEVLHEPR